MAARAGILSDKGVGNANQGVMFVPALPGLPPTLADMETQLSWEAIAGFSTAVIAMCALGLTLWQANIARHHNKLSVKPHLTTWGRTDYENHVYSVELLNNGIGPAFIESFEIFVDGKLITGERHEPIEKALKIIFPHYKLKQECSFVAKGYSMSVNERVCLISLQFSGDTLPRQEEFDHAINRVKLLIHYKSIYDEFFSYDSDKQQG